jgi:hypothetical protein
MTPELEKNNYLHVPGFLTPDETAVLLQAFLDAEKNGLLAFDPQCPTSPAAYNLMPCVKTLVKKVPQVSALCGEDVLPTYTYGRVYKHGEVLKRHTDRRACEISLTVALQKDDTDWPIWIKKPNGQEVSLVLKPGDAMLYLGCVAEHWRERYNGKQQAQFFMHYVRANGPFAYTYFDKDQRQ